MIKGLWLNNAIRQGERGHKMLKNWILPWRLHIMCSLTCATGKWFEKSYHAMHTKQRFIIYHIYARVCIHIHRERERKNSNHHKCNIEWTSTQFLWCSFQKIALVKTDPKKFGFPHFWSLEMFIRWSWIIMTDGWWSPRLVWWNNTRVDSWCTWVAMHLCPYLQLPITQPITRL